MTGYNKNGLKVFKAYLYICTLFMWDLIYFHYIHRNNFCTTTPILTEHTHNILKIMALNEVKSGTYAVHLHRS